MVKDSKTVRLGFMPNVTHATALIGIEKNIFQDELGPDVRFKPIHFVVGNSIIDAFITGQIDVAYVGPGPFINAIYRKIPIQLLANACNGGSLIVGEVPRPRVLVPRPRVLVPRPRVLVARPRLHEGMRIAIPQYGNTQDLILRSYLIKNDLLNKAKIFAIPSQDTGTAFFTMSIDAACLPEPWGTILIEKGICSLIVNEKQILNNGNYPVTLLVVNKRYAKNNPDIIKNLLSAHNKANSFINNNLEEAIKVTTKAISNISKKEIDREIIAKSMKRCVFNSELDLNILKQFQEIGVKAGYYKKGFIGNEDWFN